MTATKRYFYCGIGFIAAFAICDAQVTLLPRLTTTIGTDSTNKHFEIKYNDTLVGIASLTEDKSEYEILIQHRIGLSPLHTNIVGKSSESAELGAVLNQQIVVMSGNKQSRRLNLDWSTQGQNQGAIEKYSETMGSFFGKLSAIKSKSVALAHPFTAHKNIAYTTNPITGQPESTKESRLENTENHTWEFDDDGTLKKGYFALNDNVTLTMDQTSKKPALNGKNLVDFELESGRLNRASKSFAAIVNDCNVATMTMETDVKLNFPNIPYLLHRKIINLGRLCSTLQSGDDVVKLGTNDPKELSDSMKTLNLEGRVTVYQLKRIVEESLDELSNVLDVEKSRKSDVEIKINLDKTFTRGAIFKAYVRPVYQNFSIEAQVRDNTMSGKLGLAAKGLDSISALAFGKGDLGEFEDICAKTLGKVTVLVDDDAMDVLDSEVYRGVWDTSAQIRVMRSLALSAASSPNCTELKFRVPIKLHPYAVREIESFKRDTLQTQYEFQIANGGRKRLRMMAGRYELVVSSLVTGSVVTKHDIVIPESSGKQLSVVIK